MNATKIIFNPKDPFRVIFVGNQFDRLNIYVHIPLNLDHFLLRAIDNGDWKKETINEEEFRKLLSEKIESVKMDFVKADISRFIKDPKVLEIWSPSYFHDLSAKLKINTSS